MYEQKDRLEGKKLSGVKMRVTMVRSAIIKRRATKSNNSDNKKLITSKTLSIFF